MVYKFFRKPLAGFAALLWAGAVSAQVAPLVAQSVSAQGVINGKRVMMEMLVAAPKGADARSTTAIAAAEASRQGAQVSDGFTVEDGVHSQFFDNGRSNDAVTVFYNQGTTSLPGTLDALKSALAAWSSVKGSTFRYTYGGATTRTPLFGDGFNDIAFVPPTGGNCLYGCVLATTTWGTDYKTSAIQEFDIRLYDGAGMWTVNPSTADGYDVQTALLHELGHAAGIGHSVDLTAVMYPYMAVDEVRRKLTADETTAIAFLYPLKPSSLVSSTWPSDKHDFNLLAALGSPAPGGGTYVDHFELGQSGVNKNGDAVFAADVDIPAESLFLASNGAVTRLVAPGQKVSGLVLGDHSMSASAINDVGDVAVAWAAYPGYYREPYGVDTAVLRKPANGVLQAVVVPGVTPVPGGGRFYGAYVQIGLSQAGDVAFLGLVDSPFGDIRPGVFVADARGSIVSVMKPGDPAPGGEIFRRATGVSIASQGGAVAFSSDTAPDARGPSRRAIFLSDARKAQLVRIAAEGDAAIGGGRIDDVRDPKVNANGDVLFGALTQRPGESFAQWDLYLYSRGTLTAVVRNGDLLPDGRIFLSAVASDAGVSWSLNDAGDVVYEAVARSRQTVGFAPDILRGYYATSKGAPEYIARDLDPLAGAEAYLVMAGTAAIGGHGDVVFSATGMNGFGTQYLIRASRKVYAY